jgi:predicted nucleic acid-binding protein
MIVVSDTSAITALLQIGRAELLASIYGQVFIPVAVQNELTATHPNLPQFIEAVPVIDTGYRTRLLTELDLGEAEAIVLARQLNADELLMDEVEGRRIARREGIHVIGLLGVVLEAKGRGHIKSAREVIEELENGARFYIAEPVKQAILRSAGEL